MDWEKIDIYRYPILCSDFKVELIFNFAPIGLHHPPDGVTNPKNKFICIFNNKYFFQREEGASF
jgi:hypothetical protein